MSKPLAVVLIFSFFFGCFHVIYKNINKDYETTQSVIVQTNDTLWNIAEKVNSNDTDIRNIVQKIKELNGLSDSTIYPGQELLVPDKTEQLMGMDNYDINKKQEN